MYLNTAVDLPVSRRPDAPLMFRAEEVSVEPAVKALEREANVFTAELLMPQPDARATWARSIPECAARLAVSEEAMHRRLFGLRLVREQLE